MDGKDEDICVGKVQQTNAQPEHSPAWREKLSGASIAEQPVEAIAAAVRGQHIPVGLPYYTVVPYSTSETSSIIGAPGTNGVGVYGIASAGNTYPWSDTQTPQQAPVTQTPQQAPGLWQQYGSNPLFVVLNAHIRLGCGGDTYSIPELVAKMDCGSFILDDNSVVISKVFHDAIELYIVQGGYAGLALHEFVRTTLLYSADSIVEPTASLK